MDHQNCRGCAEDAGREPGPVTFVVTPIKAQHADSAFTCEAHLAATIRAYARQGFDSRVRVIGGKP